MSPGAVFGDGGGGNSGEGAEDVERSFETGFANFPEFTESTLGECFGGAVGAGGDESAIGDHVGRDDNGLILAQVFFGEPGEDGWGRAGLLEFAEESFGRSDDLYSGDIADHGGKVGDGGSVIDGDEKNFTDGLRGFALLGECKGGEDEKGEEEIFQRLIDYE